MVTVYDTDPNDLIDKAGAELKETIKAPDWSKFVKTGVSKERPPSQADWWHKRAAAILRKIYMQGPIGTNKLRTLYGSKKNRGFKPEKFFTASGKIIRVILQQLESQELIKQASKSNHKGRIITNKGVKFLDGIAKKCLSKISKEKN